MPLSTRPFFTDNPGDIPYEYVVPATVELRVQSIVARFDGSGASGEFYPCLAIYTQDDHLLARIRTDQAFAIGDTGVVTWGPFLRQAAAASPASSTTFECAIANDSVIGGTNQIANNVLSTISFDGVFISAGSTAFAAVGAPPTTTPFRSTKDGWFLGLTAFEWSGAAGSDVREYSLYQGLIADNASQQEMPQQFAAVRNNAVYCSWGPMYVRGGTLLGANWRFKVWQKSGVDKDVTGVTMTILYLGPDLDPAGFPPF